MYGLGAGVFFLSYAMFQLPFSLLLHKYGAPVCLSVTVVAWGLVATCFSFINGTTAFLMLRFALGLTECGAFPGALMLWAVAFSKDLG